MIGQDPLNIPKTRVKFEPGDYVDGTLRTYDSDVSGDQFELYVEKLDVDDKYQGKETIVQARYRVGAELNLSGGEVRLVLPESETEKYEAGRRYVGVLFHGDPTAQDGENRDRDLWVLFQPTDYHRL